MSVVIQALSRHLLALSCLKKTIAEVMAFLVLVAMHLLVPYNYSRPRLARILELQTSKLLLCFTIPLNSKTRTQTMPSSWMVCKNRRHRLNQTNIGVARPSKTVVMSAWPQHRNMLHPCSYCRAIISRISTRLGWVRSHWMPCSRTMALEATLSMCIIVFWPQMSSCYRVAVLWRIGSKLHY